ncbi:MAG TPA: hypothetical protein PK016_03855 [Candidatus Atribacteria bacterium]|nr:hypothetical protein [Candidatus Atribacteria bacterium]
MPPKREHLRASRILLGTQTPVVHELLELAVRKQGMEHGYLVSNSDYLGMIGNLLGQEAKREAVLHILQDWGIVTQEDVDHFSTFIPSRRKQTMSSNSGKKKKSFQ